MKTIASVLLAAILGFAASAHAQKSEYFKESANDYSVCYGTGVESPTSSDYEAMKAACRRAQKAMPDDSDLAKRITWIDSELKTKKR